MNVNVKNKQLYWVIFLAGIILCASNIWGFPIYILDEAKNSEAAREMLLNKDWFAPTFNNQLRTDKPPLHYFFMALSYQIFGVSSFSARLFSSIFGALTVLSAFYFTKKFAGKQLALYTVGVLFSSVFFMLEFHLAVPDPYLIFFVSFALFNFYDFYVNKKTINWVLFYASIGLAVLAKGPVALLLPGLIILVFMIGNKQLKLKNILEYKPFLGGLLTLLIAAPWFIAAHQTTNGNFTNGFFLHHNLHRFGNEMEGHGGLFIVTWLFVLLGLLPFSFFIVQALVKSYKDRKQDSFLRFCFIVTVIWVGFFSVSSTKLPNYPMPAYPFLAIVIAYYLQNFVNQPPINKHYFKISMWALAVVCLLLPFAAYVALNYAEQQLQIVSWVSWILLIVSFGGILSLYWVYQHKIQTAIMVMMGAFVLLNLGLFFVVFPKLTSQSPIELAKHHIKPTDSLLVYKGYDPAFLINFKRTFHHIESTNQLKESLQKQPNTKVITKKKYFLSDFNTNEYHVLLEQKSLFENHTTIIFTAK